VRMAASTEVATRNAASSSTRACDLTLADGITSIQHLLQLGLYYSSGDLSSTTQEASLGQLWGQVQRFWGRC
jgi:hypothetical protein